MIKSVNHFFLIYLFLCLFGIIFETSGFHEQSATVWDKLYFNFYGVSEHGFSLPSFLYYCIVYIGIIYLFQVHLSIILTERIYYQLIRYRSLPRWFWAIIKPFMFRLISLLILLFCITIGVGILEGKSLEFSLTVVDGSSAGMLIYHFFVNGFFQMMNYILIVFLMLWVWNKSEHGLLILAVLIVTSLPILNAKMLLPSGLNSLGNITGNEGDLYKITILLIAYLIIELTIIWYLFRRKNIIF